MTAARRMALIVPLGLLLGALLALLLLPQARERLAGALGPATTIGRAQIGGPFTLTDHTGKRVSDADFRGRYMLVYFGFTHCPDVCPTGLQVMASALDALGADADRITPIFISIDPERDTPEQMAKYVEAFHPRLIGLTGSADDIASVARAYRVYVKKTKDDKSSAGYTVDHTSIIYLMDPKGEFVAHFTHATAVDAIVSRLRRLLQGGA